MVLLGESLGEARQPLVPDDVETVARLWSEGDVFFVTSSLVFFSARVLVYALKLPLFKFIF